MSVSCRGAQGLHWVSDMPLDTIHSQFKDDFCLLFFPKGLDGKVRGVHVHTFQCLPA